MPNLAATVLQSNIRQYRWQCGLGKIIRRRPARNGVKYQIRVILWLRWFC